MVVDIDDTLNDFSHTLRTGAFPFDARYALPEDRFGEYLAHVRAQTPETGALLSTEFSFFRFRIHEQCFAAARARPDAVAFLQAARAAGWRIVICTRRDLRRVGDDTRRWLGANGLPFDHLFMASNKIAFCRAWDIPLLIDDDPFSIAHAAAYGVQLYYPSTGTVPPPPQPPPPPGPRAFRSFTEVQAWIGI